MDSLTRDSQAILLLTSHFVGKTQSDARPLSALEYNRLAYWLRDRELRPGDLLDTDTRKQLAEWSDDKIKSPRLQALLDRGMALAFATEQWQRAGLWIITRSDPDYPRDRFKKLGLKNAPPVLYGCGHRPLLGKGGLAIVGSRDASDTDLAFTRQLAEQTALAGQSVVSGGAQGVDETAMLAALEKEGTVIGIPANDLLKTALSRKYRRALQNQQLVLLSPCIPEARFNAGNAMARNKFIYCLADAAVVVHSGTRGGTWTGALENLDAGWVPLWIKPNDDRDAGNRALVEKGGKWLDEAILEHGIEQLWGETPAVEPPYPQTPEPIPAVHAKEDINVFLANRSLYEIFRLKLENLLAEDAYPVGELENQLELGKTQLNTWLKRGTEEGWLIKEKGKSVRYRLDRQQKLLA